MPIYPYVCDMCGHNQDVIKRMQDIDRPEGCPCCGHPMRRGVSIPNPHVFTPYWSDNLSPYSDRPIYVESASHKRALMKAENVVEWEPGKGGKGQWV